MGSFSELPDGTTAGGIASYNLETAEYKTFGTGVLGNAHSAVISDEWFIIGGGFTINQDGETIRNLVHWDAESERWMGFELAYSDSSDTEPIEPEFPLIVTLQQNYPNPIQPNNPNNLYHTQCI